MTIFHKYHGAGNDFIMINNLDKSVTLVPEQIKQFCDRNFGIGADGVILLEPSDKADCFMNYYNSDGTLAEMCGNGARCTAKFFLEQTSALGLASRKIELNIETRAGIKNIKVNEDDTYSVNMGAPIFESPDFPTVTGLTCDKKINIEGFDFNCVSMGNPHAVTIVEDLNKLDLKTIGPKVEIDENFPNKINVEFVEKISEDYYKVKVWERGCGATLACGTGACAVYSILNKLSPKPCLGEEITLEFPGGKLYLSENEQGHVLLRGPATFVFKGEISQLNLNSTVIK
ncbi:MAG: Diaminopimelate epimerase [Candidatus Nomurabacteria bacterium GW2011_GWF2_35_66]|uniref:Diaminopimelate epimerase n=1 Tax=Candidatus Nomurabacteria bacterium GW2011_GWE1_35_16 TaxID=1618761 RepID=A0A0G0BAZ3_9BACT|nr:MAG: Diaminopimelate epimerase [Candidatus Nomurabacteria bacterium GW2011_GWF1_34_20]KKP63386.1 MAG: Diaminopimelate epimerase [Candidatus Nomurabacteria bacterium GW2011_GWE2_34_25]KKP66578.1 MAG: Diaminopimelate epimerase [Candidatus Nomurabacteria bacterium GW2011_GWE1_35_16]KKP83624.1 MAG: Diaminopimelate epimerase [Candidatus Nomurabacteria bacterium GW2011_GWF2_35_66]